MPLIILFCLLAALFSCEKKPDLKQASKQGELVFDTGGETIRIPVEVMDIFLVENQKKYPEQFIINGPEMKLVGKFPQDLHVGYGEKFDRMIERSISISDSGNPGYEGETRSSIAWPGLGPLYVNGGTFIVKKVLGHNPEGSGSVLQGEIELDLEQKGSVRGNFVFLAVTWG